MALWLYCMYIAVRRMLVLSLYMAAVFGDTILNVGAKLVRVRSKVMCLQVNSLFR